MTLARATAAAESAPAWRLQAIAQPTSFSLSDGTTIRCEESPSPGFAGCDRYTVILDNVGTRASQGTITVIDTLPAGITTSRTPAGENESGAFTWSCATAEVSVHEIVTCTAAAAVSALSAAPAIEIPVNVGTDSGTLVNEVEASGGEAEVPATAETPTQIGPSTLSFGVLEHSFNASVLDDDGTPDTQASAHPGAVTVSFALASADGYDGGPSFEAYSVEDVKQIVIDLPAGMLGDALAAPACPLSELDALSGPGLSTCSAARMGTGVLIGAGRVEAEISLVNVIPERGFVAELGIYDPSAGRVVLLYGTVVGNGPDSHLRLVSAPITRTIAVVGLSVTLFGEPSTVDDSGVPGAFLTNPSDCGAPTLTTVMHVDSWQQPAHMDPDGQPDLTDPRWKQAQSVSPLVTGCEALQFHPNVGLTPETMQADTPSGYELDVNVPQNEDAEGLAATPPLKTAVVTLPAGVAISAAAADGLVGCGEAGPDGIELESPDAGHCPAASTVGSVEAVTTTLAQALTGSVYVAQPGCGTPGRAACTEAAAEAGEVFALYVEAGSEASGVHLKLRGTIEVGGEGRQGGKHNNLQPGQLRVSFADIPQQPLSELKLDFSGGPSALLANPQTCGTATAAAELEPWSHQPAPGEVRGTPNVTAAPWFTITGCEDKFAPAFTAGTVNSQAGAHTPLTLTFSRQDREQALSGAAVSMPPGLLAQVAGVPLCGEAEANAGSCSAASQIGTATIAAGSGPDPLWQSGPVYLTGPYDGGPFGVSIVVPADIGPFDLGSIVVRGSIRVDASTAQMTLVTDPLPQSIDGVPLSLKTVNLTIDRPGFIVNPTSCNQLHVRGAITSLQGDSFAVASRFQVGNCATLPFKPKLTALTRANGEFTGYGASLHVVVTTTAGQANIRSLKLDLPQRLPARLPTIQQACKLAVFERNPAACPSASEIGSTAVLTPMLATPMRGPVFLVSHGGTAFPDMVLVLQAQGVTIELTGALFVNAHDITSVTFRSLPDVPIRRFDLSFPEGPRSILAAGARLCGKPLHMSTAVTAQNGAHIRQSLRVVVSGCKPTRAQKLAQALKACRRRGSRRARRMCEARARRDSVFDPR